MSSDRWMFLTNHAHVLLCLWCDSQMRLRDLAERVAITEHAVHRIIGELADGGYLEISQEGRRNGYHVHADLPLRHAVANSHISDLVRLVESGRPGPGEP